MKEEYTLEEKEAILSVLSTLMKVDYCVYREEHADFRQYMDELGVDFETFSPIPKNQLKIQVKEPLLKMSKAKKREFSSMMTKIARSDGNFGPLERAFVSEILDMCEIPFVHR